MGSIGTYNSFSGPALKIKDIEDEDYIYKVACAARETISLRDSIIIPNDKSNKKKESAHPTEDIQLIELRSTLPGSNESDMLSEMKDT